MTTRHTPRPTLPLRRGDRGLRPGHGARGARRAQHRHEDVLRLPDRVRRRAQHPGLPGVPRPARGAAGRQRQGRRVGDPDRAGAQLRDRAVVPVRAEELLLPGHAEELPDLAVRRADRLRRATSTSSSTTARSTGSRSSARTWRRTPASRCTSAAPPVASTAPTHCLVDYNRAGIPLIEIVTKPMMGAGERAPEVAARLRRGAARPAQGARRLRRADGAGLDALRRQPVADAPRTPRSSGTRSETKNVNSLRSVERAVRYEIGRHAAVLTSGGTIVQETRHWHEDTGVTTSGRVKSDADDYRYFPEPDLVPVAPSRESVDALRGTLPEPPAARRKRLQADWGFADLEMRDVVNAGLVELVEETVAAGRLAGGGAQVVVGRGRPPRQRRGARRADVRRGAGRGPGIRRRARGAGRRRAGSTTRWPARSGRACSPARARRPRSPTRAASRSRRTPVRSRRRWMP